MSDWKEKALDLAYAGMVWSTISEQVGEPNTTVYNYLREALGPAYRFRESIKPEDNSTILNIPDLHCVPTYSEVLTPEGWVRIDLIQDGDTVMVSNKSRDLYWGKVIGTVPVRTEPVFHMRQSNGFLFESTTGHRHLVKSRRVGEENEIKTTEELLGKHNVELAVTGKHFDLSDNCVPYLLGFCMGDGTRDTDNWKISVKKNRKVDVLHGLATKGYLTENTNGDYTIFRLKADVTHIVDKYINKHKQVNWGEFLSLSRGDMAEVVEGYIAADGGIKSDRPNISISSTNEDLLNVTQTLCHLIGRRANRGKPQSNVNSTFPSDKLLHVLIIHGRSAPNYASVTLHSTSEQKEVTCITTESGLFLVRQNGYISITGNCPYHHGDSFDFLQAVKEKYKPTRIVCLGDMEDMHAMSYHEHDPDLRSAGDELGELRECVAQLYSMFPRMDILESNHGSLTWRKAKTHGIPRAYIREYNDVLRVGPGWKWFYDLTLELPDGTPVYYHHGKSSSVLRLSQQMGMSAVQGHYHESFSINYWGNPHGLMWGLQSGCLIDFKSYAFAYARVNVKRPVLGCSLIINSHPVLVPMVLDNGGNWIGELP